jgi:hypothetical protein
MLFPGAESRASGCDRVVLPDATAGLLLARGNAVCLGRCRIYGGDGCAPVRGRGLHCAALRCRSLPGAAARGWDRNRESLGFPFVPVGAAGRIKPSVPAPALHLRVCRNCAPRPAYTARKRAPITCSAKGCSATAETGIGSAMKSETYVT